MGITVKATLSTKQGFKDLSKFKKDFDSLAYEWVQVGFDASEIHHVNERGKKEVVSMAELAYWLHEGTEDGRIPPRPFFDGTLQQMVGKQEAAKLVPFVDELFKGFSSKKNLDQHVKKFLKKLGDHFKTNTQANFGINNKIDLVDNAPYTIKEKGRNDPLIDKGDLKEAMQVKTSK